MRLPLDTSVEAEYADGYIHSETELNDISPYENGNNIFGDILNHLPEIEHGNLIRFTLFYENNRYDLDWRSLPDTARPIRFRHGFSSMNVDTGEITSGFSGVDFGYQWNDKEGKNFQDIIRLGTRQ